MIMASSIWQHFEEFHDQTPVPSLLDDLAGLDPDHPMVSIPINPHSVTSDYQDITYSDFARAINRMAWWIVQTLGGPSSTFETLHYIAPQDLSYTLFIVAAVKTGYKALVCHPAADLDTHLSLMDSTDCRKLFYSSAAPSNPKVLGIRSSKPDLEAISLPGLDFWLAKDEDPEHLTPIYPYTRDLEQILDDPFAVIHTSASTGKAKPIIMKHSMMTEQWKAYCKAHSPCSVNFGHWRGQRLGYLSPLTIAAGLWTLLGINILFDITVVLPVSLPEPPLRPADVLDGLIVNQDDVQACIISPKCLPDTCANPEYLEHLRRVRHLAVLGAPCPPYLGEIIKQYTQITHFYGSSEAGMFPTQVVDDVDDWAYMKFDPVMPYEFLHVCHDYYELVILREDDNKNNKKINDNDNNNNKSQDNRVYCQGAFKMFQHLDKYPMKDMFSRHPTKLNMWRYWGRVDDLVKAEVAGQTVSFLPRAMEWTIESHPNVRSALVCENYNGALPLIVEPVQGINADEEDKLLESLWPTIEQANKICPVAPALSIQRDLVIFTQAARPLPRGVKGFPQRVGSRLMYQAEIKAASNIHQGVNGSKTNGTNGTNGHV